MDKCKILDVTEYRFYGDVRCTTSEILQAISVSRAPLAALCLINELCFINDLRDVSDK